MATTVQNPFDTQQAAATAPDPTQAAPAAPEAVTSTPAPQVSLPVNSAQAPSIQNVAKVNVTPDATVEGRTAGIIASNSPLMQLAESRALQQANGRGLLNSSLAVGAGQNAVMDAATGIARQDAQTSANANAANAEALNKAGAANLTSATNTGLADIESQYKNLTQASQSASSIINANANLVNQIMTNEKLDATAKQKAIDTYNANTKKSLQLIGALGGDVNLSSFLDEVLA
jgi:hypothetical protein